MNKARYNEVLTQKAKVIFGDIVTQVRVVANEHEIDRLDRSDYNYTNSPDPDIETDSLADLVICFNNGKSVQFSYSEWGTIGVAQKYEMLEPISDKNSSF